MHELGEKYRAGASLLPTMPVSQEELLSLVGASEWDVRILLKLKDFETGANREFIQRITAEGGSVAMLVSRGDQRAPFAIRRSLSKLAQLGIELEVD
jgi:hypothetical protein